MIRLLNVLAIACLVGTAIFAYSVKYETMFRAEKIVQLREKLQEETDAIGTLRAEWEHVSRPERIQALADQFLTLQSPALTQIVPVTGLPDKGPAQDEIGQKLDALGLQNPTTPPIDPMATGQITPGGGNRVGKSLTP
jgi:cell division protein FtsL